MVSMKTNAGWLVSLWCSRGPPFVPLPVDLPLRVSRYSVPTLESRSFLSYVDPKVEQLNAVTLQRAQAVSVEVCVQEQITGQGH